MTLPVTASPAVLAVSTAFSAAMVGALAEVAVLGADDLQQAFAGRSVTVGGSWNSDDGNLTTNDAVIVETAEVGAGRLLVETTTVSCVAFAGSGDVDLPTHRASVNEVMEAARTAVRGITTVDGASARAQITNQRWAQLVDGNGAGVVVAFDVPVTVLP